MLLEIIAILFFIMLARNLHGGALSNIASPYSLSPRVQETNGIDVSLLEDIGLTRTMSESFTQSTTASEHSSSTYTDTYAFSTMDDYVAE